MKKIRYFGAAIKSQEKWLNKMAINGHRLKHITRLGYEFEPCNPCEYEYRVEFVGEKSYKEARKYKQFLEEIGYRSFFKNLNLNYSVGKIRWRPWANDSGQIATSPGSYNNELLIVERKKNDTKNRGFFELHTDLSDLIRYYSKIRNMYLSIFLLCVLFSILNLLNVIQLSFYSNFAVVAFSIILLTLIIKYTLNLRNYKNQRKINE